MFRRQNLGTISMNLSVAQAPFVAPIHQFRNQVEMKTGAAEGRDLALGCNDYLRVLDRVLEIVFLHCRSKIRPHACISTDASVGNGAGRLAAWIVGTGAGATSSFREARRIRCSARLPVFRVE